MRKKTTRITIIFILVLVVVVGYYAYLSNKKQVSHDEATMSFAERTLSRNLAVDYPATPKEVVKYYNDILKCFYNENCEETQIEELGIKARELYDKDLLAANELGNYLIQLQNDVKEYKENNRRITSSSVAASTSVDFYTVDGFEFARIACGYTFSEGGNSKSSITMYLLRRDNEKSWKIYGWDLAENVHPDDDKAIEEDKEE